VDATRKIPADVLEPLPAGLWKPIMWAYCEGAPIGFVTIVAFIGLVIVKTPATMTTAVVLFAGSWWAMRALAERDPRAWRVFKRARRYGGAGTGTLPARASWESPVVRWVRRKH
jgi:type IV secretory pathway TrbD component